MHKAFASNVQVKSKPCATHVKVMCTSFASLVQVTLFKGEQVLFETLGEIKSLTEILREPSASCARPNSKMFFYTFYVIFSM